MTPQKWIKANWVTPGYMGRGEVSRSGYSFGPFAVYKGRVGWFCDHLPTKKSLAVLDAPSLNEIKANVEKAAGIPVDWNDSQLHESLVTWRSERGENLLQALYRVVKGVLL